MQIYLVGGAVRDKLLGLPIRERDWVVVGANPDEMLSKGFRQVGKDFPVFLHPETQEEYALARTERKTAPGYKGFKVHASPQVTLEQDLQRRDLTVNAIAQDENGNLIDPFNGQGDLKNKILRHVSDAFIEDPVRILRIARFSARFGKLQFSIAAETTALMKKMVANGEVDELVAERVWAELNKALKEPAPQYFFQTLNESGALQKLFPEEDNLQLGLTTLEQACKLSEDSIIRFSCWVYHLGQEKIKALCQRLHIPNDYQDLALLLVQHHTTFHTAIELTPTKILETLKTLDGFRRPQRFETFLIAAEAISRSMPGHESWPHPQREYLYTALVTAQKISAKDLTKIRLEGNEIAQELDIHRRAAISKIKRTYRWAKFS